MCSHHWKKVNDAYVCIKCGITRTLDGKYIYEKKPKDKNKKAVTK